MKVRVCASCFMLGFFRVPKIKSYYVAPTQDAFVTIVIAAAAGQTTTCNRFWKQ